MPDETVKIKFEADTEPPCGTGFENRFQMLPSPYAIRLYDEPSLFAGKIHAVICRAWKNRVKGQDLYDYVFYLSRGASVNMVHLRERLLETGFLRADVRNLIRDKAALDVRNPAFFKQITAQLCEN